MSASTEKTAAAEVVDHPGRPAYRECRHWDGLAGQYCKAVDGVRHYIPGYRCPAHTPAALQGKPEPQPGPGWPSLREVQ